MYDCTLTGLFRLPVNITLFIHTLAFLLCFPHPYRLTTMAHSPYDKLPDPCQVWVGEPSSHKKGMGKVSLLTPELVAKTATEENQERPACERRLGPH